jgi:hypothetical protein
MTDDHDNTTLLFTCFKHFAHLDQSNATVHCSAVRYSPITFRLMEALEGSQLHIADPMEDQVSAMLWHNVKQHHGKYAEDKGRIELDG